MADIRLDVAAGNAVCDTCDARNYYSDHEPRVPTAIYALHIGAGYRQPSHLCPDCLFRLRSVLGPFNVAAVNFEAFRKALAAAGNSSDELARAVRLLAESAREGE